MRAITYSQYGPPEVLQSTEIERLPLPAGHVRVAMHAAAVAPVDTKLRAGLLQHLLPITLPKVPGRDGAGIIVALADDVQGLQVGDAVCVMPAMLARGTTLKEAVLPQEQVVRKPATLTMQQAAALLQPGASAWIALMRATRIMPGMKVLIHAGSGAVGSLMVQLAHHLGAQVSATCRHAHVAAVEALGATRVIAYDREDFSVLRDQDVVFDLVGGDTHARSYQVVRPGGQLVWLVAAPLQTPAVTTGIEVTRAMITEDQEVLQQVVDLAESGVWRPVVSEVMPMAQIARAHTLLEQGRHARGRMVLELR